MQTRLLHVLEPLLHRLAPEQRVLLVQFLRFGIIGTAGFVWATIIVYALTPRIGAYWAGVASYLIVASINWGLNRIWTYGHIAHGARHKQLVRFLIANSIGFVPNLGTYSALVHFVPFCRIHPVVAVAAGAICGMFVNFFLSRRLVFAEPKPGVEMRVALFLDPPRDVP